MEVDLESGKSAVATVDNKICSPTLEVDEGDSTEVIINQSKKHQRAISRGVQRLESSAGIQHDSHHA